MTFRPRPGAKYDMPVVFGPTHLPDVTTYIDVEMVSISFLTTPEAAGALVPHHLEVRDEPVVTVSRMTYHGVDYLGGRGYEEVTVGITSRHVGPDGTVDGAYMPVVWLDDAGAMTAGREFLGYAKLHGELPPIERSADRCHYELAEYGSTLLVGDVTGMQPLAPDRLARVERATKQTSVLGWKYIPGLGGTIDADYVLQVTMEFELLAGWTGEGRVAWKAPDATSAPFSCRAVAALAELPVLSWRPAFVGHGPGRLFRGDARRLEPPTHR